VVKIWRVSQGTCDYISMYVNAVANNVMLLLHLRHDFYDIILKSNINSFSLCMYIYTHRYILRVSPPSLQVKSSACAFPLKKSACHF